MGNEHTLEEDNSTIGEQVRWGMQNVSGRRGSRTSGEAAEMVGVMMRLSTELGQQRG